MNRDAFTEQTLRSSEQAKKQYNREAILSASPGKLLVMLYDRLLLDLHRATVAQGNEEWTKAGEQLLHAQQIIAELRSSLQTSTWAGAAQLQGIYSFVTQQLINANVHRDIAKTRECIKILEPLRETWHEALKLSGGGNTSVTFEDSGAEGKPETGGVLGVG